MMHISHKGSFKQTEKFLNDLRKMRFAKNLEKYGREGVIALSKATPIDTSETANSWSYDIVNEKGIVELWWTNDNIENGIPVVILLQYGHGTRNGGYVEGIDFINPTLKPIFDKIADDVWKEVQSL